MIRIRHVTPEDRAAWLQMRCDLWPEGTATEHTDEIEAFLAGTLAQPLAVLVATDTATGVIGFAELSIRTYAEGCTTDRVAFLEGWYVVPGARRRGIGRALVEAAEAWGIGRGCQEFASDALAGNEVSAEAHHALGFEEVEQIRCFRKTLPGQSSRILAAGEAARVGDLLVRQALITDSEALAQLTTELGYPTSPEQMRRRLESILSRPEYLTLVAEVDDRVAGFIGTMVRPSYEADGPYGQIMALVVASHHRRRGVGRALEQTLESVLAGRGVHDVVVNTANHRADAHAFYEHAGYSFTGRRYRKSLPESR